MSITNNFLPFCPDDISTNLPTQGDYAASSNRTSGNKPGIASSKDNNKALRQANFIASQLAQFVGDTTNTDMIDQDDGEARVLAQMKAALSRIAPTVTKYNSGSSTYYLTYYFYVATASATVAATYTNNSKTFTVVGTIASGKVLVCVGTGAPTTSGTLTKSGGTGDSSITFYAVRAPLSLRVRMSGPGGGGSGGGATATAGSNGSAASTFGTALLSAGAGVGGAVGTGIGAPGGGGSSSLGTGPIGFALTGGSGYGVENFNTTAISAPGTHGGNGGVNCLGGNAAGGVAQVNASASPSNTGCGGAGGGGSVTIPGGNGGGAGGFVDAIINSPAESYDYSVGTGGAGGAAGTSGGTGASGSDGVLLVEAHYQ